jgi:hypothetical protein
MTPDLARLATETIEDHAVNAHPDDDLAQDTFDGRMRTREPLLAAGVLDLTRQLADAHKISDSLEHALAKTKCDLLDTEEQCTDLTRQLAEARAALVEACDIADRSVVDLHDHVAIHGAVPVGHREARARIAALKAKGGV